MGTVFRLTNQKITPVAGTKVIKAQDVNTLFIGNNVLEQAKIQADQIIKDAHAVYEAQKEQGYQDGIAEGKMEHIEKLMETVLSSVAFIENIEKTLVDVVNTAIHKVIGELDDDERIVRIVRQALTTVRSQQKVIVRVAPKNEKAVSTALASMITNRQDSFLDIVPDAHLKGDDCILESELGVVNASLDVQLKALKNAFSAKIQN